MNTTNSQSTISKKNGVISCSKLITIAFATAFFPRLLDSFGAPSAINFVHFIFIPLVCLITLLTGINVNKEILKFTYLLISGLFLLLTITIASAVVNQAGIINALLEFMLLAEPFIFLVTIVYLPLSPDKFNIIKKRLLSFFGIHLFLVFVQKYVLRTDTWEWVGMEGADRIQGAFFISGAGHVVGCSVSLTFALYYLLKTKNPLWLRILVFLAAIWNIIIADGKQVLLTFLVAMVLLLLVRLNDIVAAFKYIIGGAIIGTVFWWCIQNLEAFAAFNTWIRPEIYGPDGEATLLKTASFRIIPTYYESILNWFFGLGPGHTVGRLGGWMLKEYIALLYPLGSTIHPASQAVWQAVGQSWLGSQSSMFSPLFSWAGIWGDLGILGLAAYLYLAYVVWSHACKDDLSRFFLLTILIFGCIFSQMEEPGYMLSVACIIGIQYQENLVKQNKNIIMPFKNKK